MEEVLFFHDKESKDVLMFEDDMTLQKKMIYLFGLEDVFGKDRKTRVTLESQCEEQLSFDVLR